MDPMLVLDHVFELGAAAGLLYLCLATGSALAEWGGLTTGERPIARLVYGMLLGIGAYGGALLALGLVGLLRPWSIALLSGTVALGVRRQLIDVAEQLGRCWRFAGERWDRLTLAALGLIGLCLLIQASAPPTDWDALIYHLEAPRAWLARGAIHLPPDNLHAAFTGLVHVLYLPLLAIDASSATATLNVVLALLLALLLLEFGDRHFDRMTGRVAAVTLFGSPAILFVAMTPRVDVTLALFLTAALYALFATLFDEEAPDAVRRGVQLSALVLGLATGVKLIALPWILCLAPVFLWTAHRNTKSLEEAVRLLIRATGAFLVGALPWMAFRWHLVDAPLYPALAPRHIEPWLQPWYGTEWLGEGAYETFEAASRYTSEVFSLDALLFHPSTLTPEREGAFYFPGLLLWLVPLAILRPRDLRLWLLVLVGVVFVPLLPALLERGGRTNLRFVIPALPVLTLAASRLLAWAYRRTGAGLPSRAVVGALVVLSLVPASLPFVFRWSEMPVFGHLAGVVSEEEYLRENEDPDVYLWAPTARWLNARLGQNDRLLMLFEGRGFPLQMPKLQDNLMANWPLVAAVREPDDCLRRAGITHVLVNYGVLGVHFEHGMPPSTVSWASFDDFARQCLERTAVISPYALYRVVGGGGEVNTSSGESTGDTSHSTDRGPGGSLRHAGRSSPPRSPVRSRSRSDSGSEPGSCTM